MTFDFSAVSNNTQPAVTGDFITKPVDLVQPEDSVWNLIPKEPKVELPVYQIKLDTVSTDSILDDKGINHLEPPKGEKPSATIKGENGETQQVYTNPDGSSTVVTGNPSAIAQAFGAEYSVATYDKDGNKTKETTASGLCPRTESTKTYNEDGSVSSEVVTKTNLLTGEVETVVREYLADGSYVETTTTKDAEGKESAGGTYVYDKDGNKIDVNDMTEEQYNKVLKTKEEFDEIGKFSPFEGLINDPELMDRPYEFVEKL